MNLSCKKTKEKFGMEMIWQEKNVAYIAILFGFLFLFVCFCFLFLLLFIVLFPSFSQFFSYYFLVLLFFFFIHLNKLSTKEVVFVLYLLNYYKNKNLLLHYYYHYSFCFVFSYNNNICFEQTTKNLILSFLQISKFSSQFFNLFC